MRPNSTDYMYNGGLPIAPKFAKISFNAATGNQEIVAAVPNKKIRVLQVSFLVASAETLTWKSATTAISGAMPFPANGGISEPFCPVGLFETTAGEALNLHNTTGGIQVSGRLVYIEV